MIRIFFLIFYIIFLSGCDSSQSHPIQKNKKQNIFHQALENELSCSRGQGESGAWPREIELDHITRKWNTGESILQKRKFFLASQPKRIVAHSVGVSEILWAIVPRERLSGFHESCTHAENSILSEEFQRQGPIFSASQTEKVITWKPDIVFVASYSDYAFQQALSHAGIMTLDTGYVGNMAELKKQILFLGECLGEEGNARELIKTIEKYTAQFPQKFPILKNIRVLDYSSFNTVSGKDSTFQAICDILGLINVGAEAGIQGFKTVEAEWILKQNPQAIVFCSYAVQEKLQKNPLLKELKAVKMGHLVYIEPKYLSSISQYMIAAANQLAEKLNALDLKTP